MNPLILLAALCLIAAGTTAYLNDYMPGGKFPPQVLQQGNVLTNVNATIKIPTCRSTAYLNNTVCPLEEGFTQETQKQGTDPIHLLFMAVIALVLILIVISMLHKGEKTAATIIIVGVIALSILFLTGMI